MYRRDHFRQDLIVDRCADLIALEDRLHELDSLLALAVSRRRVAPAARCACGAPIIWGSHFCANCGRPLSGAAVGGQPSEQPAEALPAPEPDADAAAGRADG